MLSMLSNRLLTIPKLEKEPIAVQGLEKFRQFVLKNGWQQITEIEPQPWGANECDVTTIDGGILRFFELTN